MAPFELAAQLVVPWAQLGRFGYWDDITAGTLGMSLAVIAFGFLQAVFWHGLRARRRRLRLGRLGAFAPADPPDPVPYRSGT